MDFLINESGTPPFIPLIRDYVRPSESLRESGVKVFEKGPSRIIKFPDYMGNKSVPIPMFEMRREPNVRISDDLFMTSLRSIGIEIEEKPLSNEAGEAIVDLLDRGLPTLLAVYAGIRGHKVEDFPKTDQKSVLVFVNGQAHSGKSAILAILAEEYDEKCFGFDRFSEFNPETYGEILKTRTFFGKNNVLEMAETIEKFATSHKPQKHKAGPVSASEMLDEMLEMYKSKDRPDILFVEGISTPPNKVLELDILHIMSVHSGEGLVWILPPNILEPHYAFYNPKDFIDGRSLFEMAKNSDSAISWLVYNVQDGKPDRLDAKDIEFAIKALLENRQEIYRRAVKTQELFRRNISGI